MRDLASQERLTLRRAAVSLGVRRAGLAVAGLCGAGAPTDVGLTCIGVISSSRELEVTFDHPREIDICANF
jgi:hypothetical protein